MHYIDDFSTLCINISAWMYVIRENVRQESSGICIAPLIFSSIINTDVLRCGPARRRMTAALYKWPKINMINRKIQK